MWVQLYLEDTKNTHSAVTAVPWTYKITYSAVTAVPWTYKITYSAIKAKVWNYKNNLQCHDSNIIRILIPYRAIEVVPWS